MASSYPSCEKDCFKCFPSHTICLPPSSTLFLSSAARSTMLVLLVFELLKHFDEVPCGIS